MEPTIEHAISPDAIARCYGVMHQLRPHLGPEDFLAQVERQKQQGYQLAYLEVGGEVRAVAGYRISECLAWGRFLYVDDLVTRSADQSAGFGSRLFDWVVADAQKHGCDQIHLDSGVQRHGAHRFYLHKGLDITSHHFAMRL
jgi:GNAT superfamily N-acetyltransferase